MHLVSHLMHHKQAAPSVIVTNRRAGVWRGDPKFKLRTALEGNGHAVGVRHRVANQDGEGLWRRVAHLVDHIGPDRLELGGNLARKGLGTHRIGDARVVGLKHPPAVAWCLGRGRRGRQQREPAHC